MANRNNPHGFVAETNLYGGTIPIYHGLATSATAAAAGDILFATAGYVTPTETTDKAPIGVAISDWTSTEANSNPTVLFYPALDGIVFSAQEDGNGTQALVHTLVDYTGSAAGNTSTSTQQIDTTGSSDNTLIVIGVNGATSVSVTSSYAIFDVQFTRSKFTGKSYTSAGIAT